jgi:hypothetical protein
MHGACLEVMLIFFMILANLLSSDKGTKDGPGEASIKQYERLTEDWRFQHRLIWEIPTIGVTIMAGILAVSYTQLHTWPRFILLSVGALLLFGLAIAVVKHRFGADYRSQYIEESESRLGIPVYPLSTKKALEKMKKDNKQLTNSRILMFIVEHDWSAELFLMRMTFLASIILTILATWEIGTITVGLPSLYVSRTS